ncbi:MAG: hypothetical protein JKY62_00600 [Desulfocapsa sp.]|nr:hypothetical protein [Desulfocapsa sp.]
MKRFSKIRELTVWFFLGTCFVLSGCSGDSTDNKEYLVRVNDFHISTADVDKLLKLEIQLDSNFYLSEDTRTAFVQQLVQTQLLIQEARKRKLDERESFRQTIQRHWECTLIRDLLEEEGEQIRETTVVTQEEIEAYFLENKDFLGEGTLQQLSPELSKKIEDKKVTDQLEKWIAELKSAAIIDITDQKLAAQVNRKND